MIFRWFLFLSIVSKAIRGAKSDPKALHSLPPLDITVERSLQSNEDRGVKVEMASGISDGDIDIVTSDTMLDNKYGVFDACDESKCVSRGGSDLFEGFFTCYGDDSYFPKMCSDGFLPMLVDDEPPLLASLLEFGVNSSIPLDYFTCCPPNLTVSSTNINKTNAIRHCSDPIIHTNVNLNSTMNSVCDDQGGRNFAQPRQGFLIGQNLMHPWVRNFTFLGSGSFVCCDSTPTNNSSGGSNSSGFISATKASDDFNNLECVPYRNEHYEVARAQWSKWLIISCDFANGDFPFPRPLYGEETATSMGRYQCCRDGPAMGPYVQDKTFKQFVYPQLILWSIMAFVSAILVMALLAPLLIKSKRKNYNVYNFLVVGLSAFDFVYASFQVVQHYLFIANRMNLTPGAAIPSHLDDGYTPNDIYQLLYLEANMMFNCLMCHQVWVLLTRSWHATRIKPPSWTSMNLKILAVYFPSILIGGVADFLLRIKARRMYYNGNVENSFMILNGLAMWYLALFVISMVYLLSTSIIVWYRGYIPKATGTSPKDRALRELSIYFFRIIWVFMGIWLPGCVLYYIGRSYGLWWFWYLGPYTIQIQAIITFFVLLTKSDVRQYVIDLVTLSYLNYSCTTKSNNATIGNNLATVSPNTRQPGEPSNRVSSITVTTLDNTERESLGSRLVKPQVSIEEMVVRISEDSETMDEACDEETGVGLHRLERITIRPPLTVSATGNTVPIANIQLAVNVNYDGQY